MKEASVRHTEIALDLNREIVGVRFLDFEEDYVLSDAPHTSKKGSMCQLIRMAMDGNHLKVTKADVLCDYARFAVGLDKPDNMVVQGRSYQYCGLYETRSVARKVTLSLRYLDQEIYGLEIGPLRMMQEADLVIIADYAETIMRVIQGYAYKFGDPENLSLVGSQAMCSDMISKPFSTNDLNLSLMCRGTRARGRFERGELSVAFPINQFDAIAEGIVMTVNPVLSKEKKKKIREKLKTPDELGISIDEDYVYVEGLRQYDRRLEKLRRDKDRG